MTFLSVTQAADEIGCRPRDISDAFYHRWLDESKVIWVANRRVIPLDYLPEIRRILTKRGKVREVAS